MALEQFLPLQVLSLLIVFTRVAAAVMILPGIGEAFVPMRVRLLFALLLTVVVSPLISSSLPLEPKPLLHFLNFYFLKLWWGFI